MPLTVTFQDLTRTEQVILMAIWEVPRKLIAAHFNMSEQRVSDIYRKYCNYFKGIRK